MAALGKDRRRFEQLRLFEADAEMLVVLQLDLLAQVEAQLRAIHQTMRRIERLRGPEFRVGPQLTDSQRGVTLSGLSDEVEAIDAQLTEEHECCSQMQVSLGKMHACLASLKRVAVALAPAKDAEDDPSEGDQSGT